uniref:Acidic mammalian chitinase-like n=1 Tax=Nicotiana tabacum TaxID=4097 RepID=A0A1S4BX49_TOBAC|nr:PREDICTED: acidic mammalian chitinase-like [Nicotiana tabacum]
MPPFPSTSPPSPLFIPIFPVPSLPPFPGTIPPYMPLIPPSISPSMPPVPASCPPSAPSVPYSTPPSPSMPSIPVSSPPIMPPAPAPIPLSMPPVPAPVPYHGIPVPAPGPTPAASGIKGAYWLSWLAETVPSSSIPTEYFTHIFYAFAVPDNTSFQLNVSQADEQSMINFTATIHSKSPATKTMLSIGGDTGSPILPSMMSCHDNRAAFIKSTIDVARKCGFDGLDLDWEFPTKSENMHNLALLLKEWRLAISIESLTSSRPPLILSAALSFSPDPLLSGTFYPREALKNYLDFLNPMCYNYKGSWDTSVTGAPALLYDKSSNISTSYGISAWKQNGVPSTKLVMGIPLFGKTWKLKDPNDHRIGASAVGIGPGTQGEMSYNNIVTFNSENNATIVYNNETVSTYSYAGTNWIGYDDINSIKAKIKYAKTQGIGGYFFWALGYDSNWTLSRAGKIPKVLPLLDIQFKFYALTLLWHGMTKSEMQLRVQD